MFEKVDKIFNDNTIRFNKNNVPILRNEDVEAISCMVLETINVDLVNGIKKIHTLEIIEDLVQKKQFLFNIAPAERFVLNGEIIAGKYSFVNNVLSVNEILFEDELIHVLNFTLAHELGHFILHRHKRITRDLVDALAIFNEEEFDYSKKYGRDNRFVEYQANKFAASFLMPKYLIKAKVIEIQEELGINHHLGTIFLDNQQQNKDDYNNMLVKLQDTFDVSKIALRIRLQETGILKDENNYHLSKKTKLFQ